MKQGMIFILLMATISAVGYALYYYTQQDADRVAQRSAVTAQPTSMLTPTTTATAQVSVAVVVPTAQSGPSKLPNTGVFDGNDAWGETPTTGLLIGLLITSTALLWLGRRS